MNQRHIRYTGESLEEILSSKIGGQEQEKTYGVMSLFSHWRLVLNTILLIVGRTITNIAYLTIMLNCSRMGGNPFMNFFWQSLIELPAFVLGQYFADRLGRRFTNSMSFMGAAILCIPVIMLIKGELKISYLIGFLIEFLFSDPLFESYTIVGAILIKFFVSINFFISNLQAMETYPTCLRQTGVSVGSISANVIGMIGPYIVLLVNVNRLSKEDQLKLYF